MERGTHEDLLKTGGVYSHFAFQASVSFSTPFGLRVLGGSFNWFVGFCWVLGVSLTADLVVGVSFGFGFLGVSFQRF